MLISLITATYNSEELLQSALDSYKIQNYQAKELIVIDGNSQDATLSIIQSNAEVISYHQSEKDDGIYDALNKGILSAKGEIIGILHSDDILASPDVLQKVADKFKQDDDLMAVYGDLEYIDRKDSHKVVRYWESGDFNWQKFSFGWMPPHPTLFIRANCFKEFGSYDLKYRSAADYDLILRFLYQYRLKTAYIPEVLVKMRVGGTSNVTLKNRWRANREDYEAMKINGIRFPFLAVILKPLRKLNQFWTKNNKFEA
ncbi:glycosyltransferase [Pelobium sp.]|nr:glycosyltransferase family 2 protein [Pelobium sp.]MDA9555071.1 glycosyltransferase [Pelobium sp.]